MEYLSWNSLLTNVKAFLKEDIAEKFYNTETDENKLKF